MMCANNNRSHFQKSITVSNRTYILFADSHCTVAVF